MEDNKEELRPSKMRGVAFPKAKYGVILAVIVIIAFPELALWLPEKMIQPLN